MNIKYLCPADIFTCDGPCRLFSFYENEGRAVGHLYDPGDLPEELGRGHEGHQQRRLHGGVRAVKGAM
jgi:hypothetical protein